MCQKDPAFALCTILGLPEATRYITHTKLVARIFTFSNPITLDSLLSVYVASIFFNERHDASKYMLSILH